MKIINTYKNHISLMLLAIAGWLMPYIWYKTYAEYALQGGVFWQLANIFAAAMAIGTLLKIYIPLIFLFFIDCFLRKKPWYTLKVNIESPIYDWFLKLGLICLFYPLIGFFIVVIQLLYA